MDSPRNLCKTDLFWPFFFVSCIMFFLFVKNKFYFLSFHKYKRVNQAAVNFSETFRPLNFQCPLFWRTLFCIQAWADPHMYDSLCTQYCCCCCKECETESKTKEAEFKQSIKMPALQLFFIALRSLSHTRSIFGPWHIEKDGVWMLMRATEVVLGAMNRHIFSLKGFEMKLIKPYTTQTIDSREIYLQSHPAQMRIRSLSSIHVFFSANWNLLLRERHLGSCEKYFQ